MPAHPGASSSQRVQVAPVEGAAALFTPEFQAYLLRLHDELGARVHALRAKRDERLTQALQHGRLPAAPAASAAGGDWKVPPVPKDLATPGIEISGPCSITSMFINALNPGPEGERAEGDLDDDEDSAGHRLVDTVRACHNRLAAVNHELQYVDPERKKEYRIAPGELPFFMHRERGLHLDEPEVTVDGTPSPPPSWAPRSPSSIPGAPRPAAGRASTSTCPRSTGPRSAPGTATSSIAAARSCRSSRTPRSGPSRWWRRSPRSTRWRRCCTRSGRTRPG